MVPLAAGLIDEECHSARALAQFLLNCKVCRPTGSGRVGRSQSRVQVDTVQLVSRAAWRQQKYSIYIMFHVVRIEIRLLQ